MDSLQLLLLAICIVASAIYIEVKQPDLSLYKKLPATLVVGALSWCMAAAVFWLLTPS